MDSGFFVIFAIAALALLAYGFYRRAQRQGDAQATAQAMGLRYESGDPLGLTGLPHRIFARGDRRRVDLTVHGLLDGRQIALADYTYTEVRHDSQGRVQQTDHRMSLVMMVLDEHLPPIQIFPESIGRKLLNVVGVGGDVQFESEEFNRAFTVLSDDRDFAFTLIDPAMMEWLQANASSVSIEIAGRHLIFATRQAGWDQMPELASGALEFQRRFPRLVWEKYGSTGK